MINKKKHDSLLDYKNEFTDKECIVLTCGPSIKEIDLTYLKKICKDRVVIAVKQSYGLVPEYVDFQVFNCNTFTPFRKRKNTITIACTSAPEHIIRTQAWGSYNIDFVLKNKSGVPINKTLAYLGNYDDWEYENTLQRPAGPAIIHEVIINLLSLFGVSKVFFVGWDLQDPDEIKKGIYEHFYNPKKNKIIKKGPPNPNSFEVIIKNSYELYTWFQSKSIDMFIISNRSHLDQRIPRLNIKDIKEL